MTKGSKLFERIAHITIMDRRMAHMGVCDMCKKEDDLRPYGPNNENICFDCAMKDEATTEKKFKEMLDGGH